MKYLNSTFAPFGLDLNSTFDPFGLDPFGLFRIFKDYTASDAETILVLHRDNEFELSKDGDGFYKIPNFYWNNVESVQQI